MPTPQILADVVRLLIQLLPGMALVCLVLAGAIGSAPLEIQLGDALGTSSPRDRRDLLLVARFVGETCRNLSDGRHQCLASDTVQFVSGAHTHKCTIRWPDRL